MVYYQSITVAVLILLMGQSSMSATRLLGVILPNDYRQQLEHQHRKFLLVGDEGQSSSSTADRDTYLDRRSIESCVGEMVEDEQAFLSMDRLCEACHEMFRHRDPNIRATCRSNCFDNDEFVFCFNHFAGGVQVARSS